MCSSDLEPDAHPEYCLEATEVLKIRIDSVVICLHQPIFHFNKNVYLKVPFCLMYEIYGAEDIAEGRGTIRDQPAIQIAAPDDQSE